MERARVLAGGGAGDVLGGPDLPVLPLAGRQEFFDGEVVDGGLQQQVGDLLLVAGDGGTGELLGVVHGYTAVFTGVLAGANSRAIRNVAMAAVYSAK